MIENERLLTSGEAAHILQMPVARIARFAKADKIPHIRLPDGEIRFIEADLWSWIEGHKQPEQESHH